ncbi:MAG: hypothetical protein ACYDGN_16235 [Acidimicrobiales bacterium]
MPWTAVSLELPVPLFEQIQADAAALGVTVDCLVTALLSKADDTAVRGDS